MRSMFLLQPDPVPCLSSCLSQWRFVCCAACMWQSAPPETGSSDNRLCVHCVGGGGMSGQDWATMAHLGGQWGHCCNGVILNTQSAERFWGILMGVWSDGIRVMRLYGTAEKPRNFSNCLVSILSGNGLGSFGARPSACTVTTSLVHILLVPHIYISQLGQHWVR